MKMARTMHIANGKVRMEIEVETKDLSSHSEMAHHPQLKKVIEELLTDFVCKVEAADHTLVED